MDDLAGIVPISGQATKHVNVRKYAAKGEKLKTGEGIHRALAISEKMAKEAGLPGIHWQLMWRNTKYDRVFAIDKRNFLI